MGEQRLITCEHCRSEIPHGANVCRGCKAEIKYGTPGIFKFVGFLLPLIAGWYAAKFCALTLGFNHTFAYIVWAITAAVGWYFAKKILSNLFGNYISFTRLKNQ